ncbi:MAG: flagellar biosynthesis anti-sigma factor FlgM [Armatimonadota bacterium]
MKISEAQVDKALASSTSAKEKILPENRPAHSQMLRQKKENLSRLEKSILIAQEALNDIPDVREDIVNSIKVRIESGEYKVDPKDIADMMIRRLKADRIR